MKDTMLAEYLNVAISIQTPAREGVRVADGTLVASDGVMLVAYKMHINFLRGEGMIPFATAKALAALAEELYLSSIEVDGTAVNLVTREQHTVSFPPFTCRVLRFESVLPRCTPPEAQLVCEAPSLKTIKVARGDDFVELVDAPKRGDELFRLKSSDAAMWYSVRQLRAGLRLFRTRDALIVFRNEKGWLSFRDDWGRLFAVTPFVKHD